MFAVEISEAALFIILRVISEASVNVDMTTEMMQPLRNSEDKKN